MMSIVYLHTAMNNYNYIMIILIVTFQFFYRIKVRITKKTGRCPILVSLEYNQHQLKI